MNMTDKVGTLYSMSPQVLDGNYDEKCDLWSVGVVSYLLLSGERPFWGPAGRMAWKDRRKIMIELIQKCEYSMTSRSWKVVSELAKEFVKSLLQMNPDDRPTATEALGSPWIGKMVEGDECKESEMLALDDVSREKQEQSASFRLRLWQLLSTSLSEDEIEGLWAYIEVQDEAGDCLISVGKLRCILLEVSDNAGCCRKEEIDEVFSAYDNLDTKINYVDFLIEVQVGQGRNTVEKLAKTFDNMDVDSTRKLACDDVRSVIDDIVPSDMTDDIWNNNLHVDNGMVDTSEILSIFTKKFAGRHRDSIRSGRRLSCCK